MSFAQPYFEIFQNSFSKASKTMSTTPTTSSLLQTVETGLKPLETFFTYTVESAYKNVKAEVTKLEDFIASKVKIIEKNLDIIKSLTAENATHSADVTKATDTVTKLKSAVS